MAESIYKVIQLVGSSDTSWEEAAKNAVERAAQSLRDLMVAEIAKLDMKVEDGKVASYRARVKARPAAVRQRLKRLLDRLREDLTDG